MASFSEFANKHGVQTETQLAEKEKTAWRDIKIGEDTFSVKMIGGRKGIAVSFKLKGIALPLLGRQVDGAMSEDTLEVPTTFLDMANILTEQMYRTDMDALIFDDLLYAVKFNGEDIKDWDEFLMCNYGCVVPLLAFTIKENFDSFFTGSGMMTSFLAKFKTMLGSTKEDLPQKTTEE